MQSLHERRPAQARFIALVGFCVAFVVRTYWVIKIQSPYNSLYNDMAGYSERARTIAREWGPDPDPFSTFFPWGAHYFYRLEHILSGGYHNDVSVCVWNACAASIATPFAVLIASRLTTSRGPLWLLAAVSAFWHPEITFVGFFTSETPFNAAVVLASWAILRAVERGRGGFLVGLFCAWAFATRPQFAFTMVMCAPLVLFHKQERGRRWRLVAAAAIPLCVVVGYSAARFHHIKGYWSLISDNGPFQRLFADTKIGLITSHWTDKKGRYYSYGFSPPSKGPAGEMEKFDFEGYIADGEILDKKRKELTKDMTVGQRVARMNNNVRILFFGEPMWPEIGKADTPFRQRAQKVSKAIMRDYIRPLAWLGVIIGSLALRSQRRSFRVALAITVANVVTMIVAAAVYWGEPRYRVPYDAFLMILAAIAVDLLVVRVPRWAAATVRRR